MKLRFLIAATCCAVLAGCQSTDQQLDTQQQQAVDTALQRVKFDMNCPTATGQVLSRQMIQSVSFRFGVERASPIDFALLACDEITGLLSASALVRPDKDIRQVQIPSVQKKWKDKAFARGVDRAHVQSATEDFSRACFGGSLELWTHVANVLAAIEVTTVGLRLDADGSWRLVRSKQGSEQPVLDHVVAFDVDVHGPDPLHVVRVDLRLRLETASAAMRGPAGYLFRRGGTSQRAHQWVPDVELRTSIAPRQVAP